MNRWLLVFLLVLTSLRLFVGGQIELSPDETYYYQWSQQLDWAYYSKGPGVALAIRAGTALLGPTELGVRLLSPLLALGTSLLIFGMARRLYGESVATWSVLMINCTPIFDVGGVVMTIDPLSVFFWAAALWAFWLALERSPKFTFYWPLAGLCMGLGFLGKYTNAMELFSVVLVLGFTVKFQREFVRPGFWIMLGVFLLAVVPPVLWNANHSWITVEHLRSRGGLDDGFQFHPLAFLEFMGAQFGVYSPLIFGGMLGALWWGCKDARLDFRSKFLVIFALPLLVMYSVLALKKPGEPNWTAPAFVSLGILTVAYWHGLAERHLAARRFVVWALGMGIFMSLAVVNTDAVRQLGIPWKYKRDPGGRLRGWQSVAIAVDDLRHKMEKETGKPLFLIAKKYQTASSLAFYLPDKRVEGPGHPPVYIPESQAIENQYSFWGRYDELTELVDVARGMLERELMEQANIKPENWDIADYKAKHDTLAAALKEMEAPDFKKLTDAQKTERRRALIRAMLAVDPALPLDEYASEEIAVSLFQGRDALYITEDFSIPPTSISNGFEKVELVATWEEKRRGLPLRLIQVFACHNYHGLSL